MYIHTYMHKIIYDHIFVIFIIYNSANHRCIPFPHSHLFCGQYITASTMVYIDYSVFNYIEANNKVIELDNIEVFGIFSSCRWIRLYMVCISLYPRCNITTQALVSPCMNDCLKYTNRCYNDNNVFKGLTAAAARGLPYLILNCSVPFKLFSLVSVDTDNCYDFNCKLSIYVSS